MVIKDFEIVKKGRIKPYLHLSGEVIIERDGELYAIEIEVGYDYKEVDKDILKAIKMFNEWATKIYNEWKIDPELVDSEKGQTATRRFKF